MDKETVIVGKVKGEDWVSTNNGGIGRTLFKLQDAVEIKDGLKKAHEHAKELSCRLHEAEEENAALREALRLKEAECEALTHDKSVLLSFVKRVSEVDIEDWEYETDDGDSMCFEFIGETEIACDAADLLGDMKGADYYCQCENTECGAWYQTGKEGDACKECKTGKLTPQQVDEY